ncbi:uncharacterized protein J3R85_005336 [Psidium guajava]|nr:uncharacterized protein J3R85_005336 [Psidium guajava]
MRPPSAPLPHLQENRQLILQQPQNEPEPDEEVPLLLSPPPRSLLRNRSSLYKQKSWSPDMFREEAWVRRKGNVKNRQTKSVTDEDLDELKGCIELGFGFDSPEAVDDRLSDTLPALGFYYAVTKQHSGASRSRRRLRSRPRRIATARLPSAAPTPYAAPAMILRW